MPGPIRVEITGDARGLQRAVGQANSSLESIGSKASAAGSAMTRTLTLPAAAFAAAAVRMAADYESSMSQIRQVTGATNRQMVDANRTIMEMSKGSTRGPRELSQGYLELAKGGLSQAQIKAGALRTTMDLATASGDGLAESANLIVSTMAQFKISAGNVDLVSDALVGAANASTADVKDLADSLTQVGGAAAGMGLGITDVTSQLAAMADQGVRGSDAGTSMKAAFSKIVSPAGLKAAKDLGINLLTANGEIKKGPALANTLRDRLGGMSRAQRLAAVQALAGTDGYRYLNSIYETGAGKLQKYADAAGKSGAASKAAAAKNGESADAMKKMTASIERAGIALGNALGPTVTKVADKVAELADSFSSLDKPTQDMITKIGLVAAAVGPALVLIGKMAAGVGALKSAFRGLAKVTGLSKVAKGMGDICGGKAGKGGCIDGLPAKVAKADKGVGGLTGRFGKLALKLSAIAGIDFGVGTLAGVAAIGAVALPVTAAVAYGIALKQAHDHAMPLKDRIQQAADAGDLLGQSMDNVDSTAQKLAINDFFKTRGGSQITDTTKAWQEARDRANEYARAVNKASTDGKPPKVKPIFEGSEATRSIKSFYAKHANDRFKINADASGAKKAAAEASRAANGVKQKKPIYIGGDKGPVAKAVAAAQRLADSVKQKAATKLDGDNSPVKGKVDSTQQWIDAIRQGRPTALGVDNSGALTGIGEVTGALSGIDTYKTITIAVQGIITAGAGILSQVAGIAGFGASEPGPALPAPEVHARRSRAGGLLESLFGVRDSGNGSRTPIPKIIKVEVQALMTGDWNPLSAALAFMERRIGSIERRSKNFSAWTERIGNKFSALESIRGSQKSIADDTKLTAAQKKRLEEIDREIAKTKELAEVKKLKTEKADILGEQKLSDAQKRRMTNSEREADAARRWIVSDLIRMGIRRKELGLTKEQWRSLTGNSKLLLSLQEKIDRKTQKKTDKITRIGERWQQNQSNLETWLGRVKSVADEIKSKYDEVASSVAGAIMGGFDPGSAWDSVKSKLDEAAAARDELLKDDRQNQIWNPLATGSWKKDMDEAQAKVDKLTGKGTKSMSGFNDAFIDAINAQGAGVQEFVDNITKLRNEKSLDPAALQQLISMGPQAGADLARALATDPAVLAAYRANSDKVAQLGKDLGAGVAEYSWKGIVDGIVKAKTDTEKYFEKHKLKVVAELVFDNDPRPRIPDPRRTPRPSGSPNSVTVNVVGNLVDPAGAAVAIRKALREQNSREGVMSW